MATQIPLRSGIHSSFRLSGVTGPKASAVLLWKTQGVIALCAFLKAELIH